MIRSNSSTKVVFIQGLGESSENYNFNMNTQFPISYIPRRYVLKRYTDQIRPILETLQSIKNPKEVILGGRSFGAFLLLLALLEFNKSYQSNIVLFSPIFGIPLIHNVEGRPVIVGSKLRKAELLMEALETNNFPIPQKLEIHVGVEDLQSDYSMCKKLHILSDSKDYNLKILQEKGHNLGHRYIENRMEKIVLNMEKN